jgi:hypothetical protein
VKDINNFTSNNNYIYLPTKNNPKVMLSIDNKIIKNNSFKLYNPFSNKAKIFKTILKNLCNFQFICNKLSEKKSNSQFIKYLNKKFNKKFISSIYIATEKDKFVLQLQSDNTIFGYLKYPLNKIGKKRVLNEKKAIEIFSNLKIIEKYLLFDYFENTPFLVLKPLEGEFSIYDKKEILIILEKMKRDKKFQLKNHPRIEKIKNSLKNNLDLKNRFEKIIDNSVESFQLVYEHGDFAPWNIIKKKNKLIPFDFEYFEENGLEYMDMIKYYYQIGKLLKKYKNYNLVKFIFSHFNIPEKEILFQIFIFNEILRKIEENKSYNEELNLLKIVEEI